MPRPLRRPSGNQIRTRRTGSFSVPRLALRLRTGPAARKEVLPLMAFSSMQTPLSGITSLKQDLRILGSILQLSAQYLPVLHKRKGGVSNEGGRGGEGNRGRVGGVDREIESLPSLLPARRYTEPAIPGLRVSGVGALMWPAPTPTA